MSRIHPTKMRLSPNAMTVLRRRYLMKHAGGNVKETPAQMFRRVADNVAHAETLYPCSRRTARHRAQQFYEMMSRLDFLPNSPTLMNAGRDLQQLSACFVLPVEDSLESIFEAVKDQALIHQSGGGTGFSFSHLRPENDVVASTDGIASGPVSFMEVFNTATEVIKQGGTRRGANMGVLRVDHPDILRFIAVKQHPQELRNFNLSIAMTDAFMHALEQGKHYALINPRTKRVVTRLNAALLFDRLTEAAWRTGEPGVIFLDTINAANPTPHIGRMESTNPCVTAETWVQTSEGPRQVADLLGIPFAAQVNGTCYPTGQEGFFFTGTRPVVRLKTVEGQTLRLTTNHLVRRVIRKTRYAIEGEWCPAGELRPGDELILNDHRANTKWSGQYGFDEGYLLGLLVGDGVLKPEKAVLSVWQTGGKGIRAVMEEALRCAHSLPHRIDFRGWITVQGRDEKRLALTSLRDLALRCGMRPGNKRLDPCIEKASSDFYKGFLRGVFDTDASVQGGHQKGISIRLAQSDLHRLEVVQRMLLRLGIVSCIYTSRRKVGVKLLPDGKGRLKQYPTLSQHELIISEVNLASFQEQIGFADSDKAQKLVRLLNAYRRQLNKERFLARVETIKDDGIEPVFDVTIPGAHAFDANGVLVHNCGEQPLLPYESCNLGSINIARFLCGPPRRPRIDYERLEGTIRSAVRFLDNVIDMSRFPLPEIDAMTKGNRKIGLGLMGFADLLIQLNIPYDSDEALTLAEHIMRFLWEVGREASAELAVERGVFPNFKGSRLESAGQRLRNATVTTIAPTGTISIIADCSPGIEPLYGISFVRTVMDDTRLVSLHPAFIRHAKRGGIYSKELMQRVAARESIQGVTDIPEPIQRLFVTAHDISPEHHVRMQAAFQKYSDSGVSKTINLPATATQQDVASAFRLAYQLRCKGITVFRSGSREKQVMTCAIPSSC
jgi:ribonucleoside-diphosphate reductase alpha chain